MSNVEYLQSEIEDIYRILAPLDALDLEKLSADWVLRESLRLRFNDLTHQVEIARGEYELKITFLGQRVLNHSIDASFLANFISRFQAVISAVSDEIMFGVYQGHRRVLPPDVLNQSTMHVVATEPGSFGLGLEGPRNRGVQLMIDVENDELPIFDEATNRVFDVFESVEGDWAEDSLASIIAALGSQRSASKMLYFAQILATNGTLVTAFDRSKFKETPREILFTSTGARRIQNLLSATTRETIQLSIEGTLTGVRWRNRTFDVQVDEKSKEGLPAFVSGHIASELRQDIRSGRRFDQPGVFIVERTTTKSARGDELAVRYRLVGLAPPSLIS